MKAKICHLPDKELGGIGHKDIWYYEWARRRRLAFYKYGAKKRIC